MSKLTVIFLQNTMEIIVKKQTKFLKNRNIKFDYEGGRFHKNKRKSGRIL